MKWKQKKRKVKRTPKKEVPDDYYHHVPIEFEKFRTETALALSKATRSRHETKGFIRWMKNQTKYRQQITKRICANPLYQNDARNLAVIATCSELMARNDDDINQVMAMDGAALVAETVLGTDLEYIMKGGNEKLKKKRQSEGRPSMPIKAALQLFYEVKTMATAILNAMACALDSSRPIPPSSADWHRYFSMCVLTPQKENFGKKGAEKVLVSVDLQTCFLHEREDGRINRRFGVSSKSGEFHPGYKAGLILAKVHDVHTYMCVGVILGTINQEKAEFENDPEGWRSKRAEEFGSTDPKVEDIPEFEKFRRKLKKIAKEDRLLCPEKLKEALGVTTKQFLETLEDLLTWDPRVITNMIIDVRHATGWQFGDDDDDDRPTIRLPNMVMIFQAHSMFQLFNMMLNNANQNLPGDDALPNLDLNAFELYPRENKDLKDFRDFCHGALVGDVWRPWQLR